MVGLAYSPGNWMKNLGKDRHQAAWPLSLLESGRQVCITISLVMKVVKEWSKPLLMLVKILTSLVTKKSFKNLCPYYIFIMMSPSIFTFGFWFSYDFHGDIIICTNLACIFVLTSLEFCFMRRDEGSAMSIRDFDLTLITAELQGFPLILHKTLQI